MKTRALLLLALPLALLAGCRDNHVSVQVQGICAPTTDCTFAAACTAEYAGYPTLDTTANTAAKLGLVIQVGNQLPDNSDKDSGRVNTNQAIVDETVVDYEGPSLPQAVLETNHMVPANGTTVFLVDVIPAILNASAALKAYNNTAFPVDMVAKLRLRGYYGDGSRFETGQFPVSVRICAGCLTTANGQLCPAGTFTCPPDSNGQLPIACITP